MGKRLYFVMSVMAMANLAALAGVVFVAHSRGYLTPERVQAAAAALRGELSTSQPTTMVAASRPVEIVPSAEQIARNDAADQIRRAELERREREIEHAWQQLETQQLAVLQQKEDLEAAMKRGAAEAEARAKSTGDSGWEKQVELIASLKAKTAKDLLREKPEPEVVRIFMELDARKTQKIIEMCKSTEERQWIGRILEQLHQQNASQAEALSAGIKPSPGA